jgi:hypothetical protein
MLYVYSNKYIHARKKEREKQNSSFWLFRPTFPPVTEALPASAKTA